MQAFFFFIIFTVFNAPILVFQSRQLENAQHVTFTWFQCPPVVLVTVNCECGG